MELEKFLWLVFLVIPIIFLLTRKPSRKVPPGSMGLPIIGHTHSFLKALRAGKEETWLRERIKKYGPVFKINFIGTPTVFLHGQAANKFIYTCHSNTLSNQQPASVRRICGERNIMEMSGEEHKRVRGALVSFLKPEVLKHYVGKIDEEVKKHLELHWHGRNEVKVVPLTKIISFNIICSLIFGIQQGPRRDAIKDLFQYMMEGMLSIPVNIPFTRFNRSLQASAKIKGLVKDLVKEKREALERGNAPSNQDLITCLLSRTSATLSDDEIVDNVVVLLIAGHDTSSVLLTFLIRLFATEPSIYAEVAQEQEQIAKSKGLQELLTWDDLVKMKYTWRVAMESLRMTPPVFSSFRTVVKDIEYEGYIIPKGWQVMWTASMTHMDENIFTDPTKFDATRFEKQPPPYSFVAFGAGPRVCPGYEFAKIETLVMVHYLVTTFTWKLASNDDSFHRDPMPVFSQDLPIHITSKKCNDVNLT